MFAQLTLQNYGNKMEVAVSQITLNRPILMTGYLEKTKMTLKSSSSIFALTNGLRYL